MTKYVYAEPKSQEEVDSRVTELCTDEFLNTLTEVASLFSIGDYTEIANFVKELHMFTHREVPVMPDWPKYDFD